MSKEDNMQLPTWDEEEQLDYGEDDGGGEGEEQPVDGPEEDPGDPVDEPCCSSLIDQSSASSSGSDGRQHHDRGAARNIGPSLPPGFDPLAGDDDDDDEDDEAAEDEDPEDPDDPGMQSATLPNTTDNDELAPTLPSVGPSFPIDLPRRHSSAPTAHRRVLDASDSSYGPAAPPEPEPEAPRRVPRGPAAPPSRVIGPAFPADLLPFEATNGENGHDEEEEEEDDDAYGPAPPPARVPMNGNGNASLAARGPASPSVHARDQRESEMEMPFDDDDDDVIGPMPASANGAEELAAERRRVAMLAAKAAEDKKVKREEWMLQLPKKLNNYGLGARTFSKSAGVSSSEQADWMRAPGTDPVDQPGTSRDDMERLANAERDAQQARIASALTASRNESLLDAHASRKRKAEADAAAASGASMSGGAPERRPFDREKDMQVRGFKSASTAEIKEKCGHLSSRFGNSNSQKFL